jgi:hypothetical protein
MTRAMAIELLTQWASHVRGEEQMIYPEIDLDQLQHDLDAIATYIAEQTTDV